uniref:Uncharacterized protein n=1 Tax=Mus musculus TaxID=10090 RepID=Q3UXG4_MOUSE|nr:unnamed protein product [Mus musculus]
MKTLKIATICASSSVFDLGIHSSHTYQLLALKMLLSAFSISVTIFIYVTVI